MKSNDKTCSNHHTTGNLLSLALTAVCLAGSAVLGSFASTTAVLFAAASLATSPLNAQTTPVADANDINPPVIEMEAIDSGVAGQDQVFTALVADNDRILDVKLYYRYSGQQAYQNVLMQPLAADTDFYLATLTTEADETRAIEYYVQARDIAGNRVVEGFAFEPLFRTLTAAQTETDSNNADPVATAEPPPPAQPETSSGGIKLWRIVMGVLVVGAIAGAAAASGGGGGNSGNTNTPAPQTVPLTITIGTP